MKPMKTAVTLSFPFSGSCTTLCLQRLSLKKKKDNQSVNLYTCGGPLPSQHHQKTRLLNGFITFIANVFPQPGDAQLKALVSPCSDRTWLSRWNCRVKLLPQPRGQASFSFLTPKWTCSSWRRKKWLLNCFWQLSHCTLTAETGPTIGIASQKK